MCSLEEKLERENKLPPFYRRDVEETFALVRDSSAAACFLTDGSPFGNERLQKEDKQKASFT